MQRIIVALLLFALVAIPAHAQPVVYERTGPVYRIIVPTLKALPEGYHHWREVPQNLQRPVSADGSVLCKCLTSAIGYGKRLAMGYRPSDAVRLMAAAWGTVVCGFTRGIRLTPEHYAVRGTDTGERMEIVRWRDQFNNYHYTGWPKDR